MGMLLSAEQDMLNLEKNRVQELEIQLTAMAAQVTTSNSYGSRHMSCFALGIARCYHVCSLENRLSRLEFFSICVQIDKAAAARPLQELELTSIKRVGCV